MARREAVVQEAAIPLLLRILYFFLFGWWATGVWILVAWLLNITVIGLPLGVWMLNRVPQVLTLRPARQVLVAYERGEGVDQARQVLVGIEAADVDQVLRILRPPLLS